MAGYNPAQIEPKWQEFWDKNKTFEVQADTSKPKYYVLDMFPYPSGAGLHVGHPEGYTATDIVSRYKRMQGMNVLHPMGWDAFGLPAEQFAIQTGTHPEVSTKKNIANFKRQIKSLGFSYDWSREIATSDADYYSWTQWIFMKLYEKGLAYLDEVPVNWCPALGTVLANEEVIDGKSERGGHDVVRRPMKQWMLKITDYAESLLEGLDDLDWPQNVIEMQRNWIGKSEGAQIEFEVDGRDQKFTVYTTRPDTLFGATYCVLAPEHPIISNICSSDLKEDVLQYVDEAKRKSDRDRQKDAKDKTGVFTGAYAINPVNNDRLPIFVADYVLITYGTGSIMAVPAHDQRDWEFAKKFDLPIREVISGGDIDKEAYVGDGSLVNSGFLDGLKVEEAKAKMLDHLESKKLGTRKVNYKLRDWLFSRQRYWGEPFPVLHSGGKHLLVDESELPVELPPVDEYKPTEDGEPPLARAGKQWLEVTLEDGSKAIRETNTMPQWAGSCWYYLRYISPKNEEVPWDKHDERYWMPVDLYIGGTEHAVLHLLYSRFWHHVLYDLGLVSTKEPFKKLFNQGMILGEDGQKMSKARGNVINPDDIVSEYGADTLRLYEMFLGPLEQVKPWNTNSVGGVYKFLKRSWSAFIGEDGGLSSKIDLEDKDFCQLSKDEQALYKATEKTIKKVTEDIDSFKFHTAISALMSLLNEINDSDKIPYQVAKKYILLLSPFAPHLGEELWSKLGNSRSLAYEQWPEFDKNLVVDSSFTVVVQVNGKRRAEIEVEKDIEKDQVLRMAKDLDQVKKYIEDKQIRKEIYVPGKIINIVV